MVLSTTPQSTQLRCGGKYYLYFVGKFMLFPAVKKSENVKSDTKQNLNIMTVVLL